MLALGLTLLALQKIEAAPDRLHRVVPLEIHATDPILEGHGPSQRVEQAVDFEGTLYVWTKSEDLDLYLRAEDETGRLSKEDESSGGGKTPCLEMEVGSGTRIAIRVAASRPGLAGKAELHIASTRETKETKESARSLVEALGRAREAKERGDFDRARGILASALDGALEVPGAGDSAVVVRALESLGQEAYYLGDLQTSSRACSTVRELRERTLPGDHPGLQRARLTYAVTIKNLGDLQGARQLEEKVIEVYSRTLPDDHPDLQFARGSLAVTLQQLGDLRGALALERKVLEVRSRTLADDHIDLQFARANLAATLKDLGDLRGARALEEKVLEVFRRTRPDDDTFVQNARQSYALTIGELGNPQGERALEEKVLEVLSHKLPDNHPDLQRARQNLGGTLLMVGDVQGARVLFEKVLEVSSHTLPEDHPDLQRARANLALAIQALGDSESARALEEKVVEVLTRTLPGDHPDLQTARGQLAGTLCWLGDLAGARDLAEKVLEILSSRLADDHPDLQLARGNLAATKYALGDLSGARALQEKILDVLSRTHSEDDPSLQLVRRDLARTCAGQGDWKTAIQTSEQLSSGLLAWLQHSALTAAPREMEERSADKAAYLSWVLSLGAGCGLFDPSPDLDREGFLLVESLRAPDTLVSGVLRSAGEDEGFLCLRREAVASSAELARLVQGGASRDELAAAIQARDLAQRSLVERVSSLPQTKAFLVEPTVEALASTLKPDEALIEYRRYTRTSRDKIGSEGRDRGVDSLLAFVVRADRQLARIELGPVAAIETAVDRWREAIGTASRARGDRGVGVPRSGAHPEPEAGESLRKLVVDPLLPPLKGTSRWVIALDDVLHLVPLDALPEGESLVGERRRIEIRASLRELLWPRTTLNESGAFLVLGGADYQSTPRRVELEKRDEAPPDCEDDAPDVAAAGAPVGDPAAGQVSGLLRGGAWEKGFCALPATLAEADEIAALRTAVFGKEASYHELVGSLASRASIELLAPRARFLHLATHGWFAPESVRSVEDRAPLDAKVGLARGLSLEEQARGSIPMVLCGLALAGANRPADALGRYEGLVTAEEISSWDLRNCELAVLSACDTNVGVRRAGQGVASLQKALHMAGARTAITSLWKVPDDATRDLMVDFYRRIWVEKKPKAEALWEAKMRLRTAKDARGTLTYSTRDWAAWVLTGDLR